MVRSQSRRRMRELSNNTLERTVEHRGPHLAAGMVIVAGRSTGSLDVTKCRDAFSEFKGPP
jgi:hypothetical protein